MLQGFPGWLKVVKARLRGGFGTVHVRWTGDDGTRGTIRLVANNRGVYVEGQVAEVLRADC